MNFNNLLDQIFSIEKQGFDPYNESYFGRLDMSESIDPPLKNNALNQGHNGTKTYADYQKTFSDLGREDILVNMVDEEGKLNLSNYSSAYNALRESGVPKKELDDYLDFTNNMYRSAMDKTYYEGAKVVRLSDGDGLSFEKDIRRESISPTQFYETYDAKKNKMYQSHPVGSYKEEDVITYPSDSAMKTARSEYKKSTLDKLDITDAERKELEAIEYSADFNEAIRKYKTKTTLNKKNL